MEPNIIKYFEPKLDEHNLKVLKEVIHQYIRHAQVHFSVMREDEKKILIKVWQKEPHNGNAFTSKRLVEITKEVFIAFTGKTINVNPFPFVSSPPDIVTPEWIKDRLTGERGEVKAVAKDLGIDAATISGYINGLKPLSGVVRAMFYYYLKSRK